MNTNFNMTFEGFYNSIYDFEILDRIEDEINEGYLKNDDNIDYSKIFEAMSEVIFDSITELFEDEFELNSSFKYGGLDSPQYYNYRTDYIIASTNNTKKLMNYFLKNAQFIDYVNENSKSIDGFTSFYNGINEVKQDNSIFLHYLFSWFYSKNRCEIIQHTFDTNNVNECIYNNF